MAPGSSRRASESRIGHLRSVWWSTEMVTRVLGRIAAWTSLAEARGRPFALRGESRRRARSWESVILMPLAWRPLPDGDSRLSYSNNTSWRWRRLRPVRQYVPRMDSRGVIRCRGAPLTGWRRSAVHRRRHLGRRASVREPDRHSRKRLPVDRHSRQARPPSGPHPCWNVFSSRDRHESRPVEAGDVLAAGTSSRRTVVANHSRTTRTSQERCCGR